MDFHRTPYLGSLVSLEHLEKYIHPLNAPGTQPVTHVAASPEDVKRAGENVSGRILNVTTNFPVACVSGDDLHIRDRRGLSSLSSMLKFLSDETEWDSLNIAWPGDIEGDEEADKILTDDKKEKFGKLLGPKNIPVWLDGPEWKWREYAERVLWPTLHYSYNLKDLSIEEDANFAAKGYQYYKEFNEKYAEAIIANYREGDIIMIHDLYLLLLPSMLREKLPDALIGLYVHSPFPSSELFRSLPQRVELLTGMLGSTIIGFQSYQYIKHFISATTRITGLESSGNKLITPVGRYVACVDVPFGIDVNHVLERSSSPEVLGIAKEIHNMYGNCKIIVGRDKLDNTQGILQKLRAFLLLLDYYPQWRGKVVFVQITTKTFQFSPSLETQMAQLISYINSRYGDLHYTPIIHFTKHMVQDEYFALLREADVGFFTPLREGASSVAIEYAICQEGRKDSKTAMVLSEFMGISDMLVQGDMGVNPYDPVQVAYNLNAALVSEREVVEQKRLFDTAVQKYNVGSSIVEILSHLVLQDLKHEVKHYTPVADVKTMVDTFKSAERRLICLDYDGTLTPIVRDPAAAVPNERIQRIMKKLCDDPQTTVWIISGRDTVFLDKYWADYNINLSAEHGCYVKWANQSAADPWDNLVSKTDMSWMQVTINVLQSYTERTEGTSVEVKKSAITWHYRKADPDFGRFQASHLRAYLELTVAKKYPIEVMAGKANVEIRPKLFNKGEIVRTIFEEARKRKEFPEFVLTAGDDTTDEDMFRVLAEEPEQKGIFPVLVGPQSKLTIAKYHVDSVDGLHSILEALSDTIDV